MVRIVALACLIAGLIASIASAANPDFELRDGDRVVFLGGTLVEREQAYGCWETMLTVQFPRRSVVFRNLGASGGTVWNASVDPVVSLRPTVIFLAYGADEASAGEPGLKRFVAGLTKLLDELEQIHARIVLLLPMKRESFPPLSDAAEYNHDLWHYRDAVHEAAVTRDHLFLDLDRWLEPKIPAEPAPHWTEDGTRLSAIGYLMTAAGLENELRLPPAGWKVVLDAGDHSQQVVSAKLTELSRGDAGVSFAVRSDRLPFTAVTREHGRGGALEIRGLAEGHYRLTIDGQAIVSATADEWSRGVAIDDPAELRQIDELRAAILKKNECFARRDPSIDAQEKRIAELRVPREHRYRIERVEDGSR